MRPHLIALVIVAALTACNRPPDPLAPFIATCKELEASRSMKAGLTIEQCAKELKQNADAADPALHAGELVARIEALIKAGKSDSDASHRLELRDAIIAVQDVGKPAVPLLMERLKSPDGDLRIAVAKALINVCADECQAQKFDCIVPALLEGTRDGLPPEVRIESVKGLTRCTGKGFGDDAKAWREWWETASKK
ncbi:MAG: HEAT repeat domain-containing protein [Deltaproteobacteria bacterium]|nr:HEAT repeat domain-containing protein [Deltaproteobacteria bacterium]